MLHKHQVSRTDGKVVEIEFQDSRHDEPIYLTTVDKPYLMVVAEGATWAWSSERFDCYANADVVFMIHK